MKSRLTPAVVWLTALLAASGRGFGQQSTVKPLTRGGFIAGTTSQFAHEIGNLQPLLAAMGQSYPATLAYSFANNATSAFVGSTGQYGWSEPLCPVSTVTSCNRISFLCKAIGTTVPSTWRLTISTGIGATGTILADTNQIPAPGGWTTTSPIILTADFPTVYPGASQLYCNVSADQPMAPQSTNGVNPCNITGQYSTGSSNIKSASQSFGVVAGSVSNAAWQIYQTAITTVTTQTNTGFTPGWSFASSTYSAWGSPLGNLVGSTLVPTAQFNQITIGVESWDNTVSPPTQVRIRIKDSGSPIANTNGYNGKVLADVTVPLTIAAYAGGGQLVTADIPNGVSSPNLLWIECFCDQHVSFFSTPTTGSPLSPGYGTAMYRQGGAIPNPPALTNSVGSGNLNIWAQTRWVNNLATRLPASASTSTLLQGVAASIWQPQLLLPSNVYLMSGREYRLFFDQAIMRPFGQDNYYSMPYTFTCISTKGTQFKDRWVYTPVDGDAGTNPTLEIKVYYSGILVADKTTTMNFVTLSSGTHTRQLLGIGDSLTPTSQQAEEIRLTGLLSGTTFTFVGGNTGTNDSLSAAPSTALDSTGVAQTLKWEGWPGESMSFFVTGSPTNNLSYNSGHGPFFYSGALNLLTYQSTVGVAMASGDWVSINRMGNNDLQGGGPVTSPQGYIATYISSLDTFIAAWQILVPGIRIAVGFPMRIGSQDGVGYDLQSSTYTSAIQWRYNMDLGLQAWLAHYDTPAQRANNVFVNPTYLCQDMVNDYLYTSIPQSQYNSASRLMIFNFPHPASWGYWSIGATDLAFFKFEN